MIARSVIAGKLRKEREVSFPIPPMDIAQPLMGRRRFGLRELLNFHIQMVFPNNCHEKCLHVI